VNANEVMQTTRVQTTNAHLRILSNRAAMKLKGKRNLETRMVLAVPAWTVAPSAYEVYSLLEYSLCLDDIVICHYRIQGIPAPYRTLKARFGVSST
jgi:hypothetical protein